MYTARGARYVVPPALRLGVAEVRRSEEESEEEEKLLRGGGEEPGTHNYCNEVYNNQREGEGATLDVLGGALPATSLPIPTLFPNPL